MGKGREENAHNISTRFHSSNTFFFVLLTVDKLVKNIRKH